MKPTQWTTDLEASIAARIAWLVVALGDPFHEDARLLHYATALEEADRANARKPSKRPTAEFLARVDAFLAAHEIALAIVSKRVRHGDWENMTHRALWLFDVESIRRGHVRTVAQLKFLEQAFFTEWNEGSPRNTMVFWRKIARAGLPYERRDLLAEILERGRITSREHYEFAVDAIGIAEDERGLSAAEVDALGRMIDAYEARFQ